MKTFVRALALALPFLAVPAEAHAWGSGGFQVCFNLGFNKNKGCDPCAGGGGGGGGAPWYTYWPYDAYFQVPAMSAYPYWPAPMTTSMQPGGAPAPVPHDPYQAVGYYTTPPSYWYGR